MSIESNWFWIALLVAVLAFGAGYFFGRASAARKMAASGEALRRMAQNLGIEQLPGEKSGALRERVNRTFHRRWP